MGKSAKKTNRKMKRTIRRTVGALCLVSAITVAAIPVPENYAATDPVVVPEYPVMSSTADYLELSTVDSSGEIALTTMDFSTAEPGAGDKAGKAYNMFKDTAGNWTLDWQFKFFKPKGFSYAFLAKCNSANLLPTLNVNRDIFIDYVNFLFEDYNHYLLDTTETYAMPIYYGDKEQLKKDVRTLNYTYTLPEDYRTWDKTSDLYKAVSMIKGSDNLGQYELDYQNYLDYTAWRTYYDAHGGSDEGYDGKKYDPADPAVRTPGVDKVSGKLFDIYGDDASQKLFFCNEIFGESAGIDVVSASKTVYVGDVPSPDPVGVFVPHLKSTPADPNAVSTTIGLVRADSNDFLCNDSDKIAYIGANAFKDVTKSYKLIVAPEILMFGDSAFEHSAIEGVTLSRGACIGNRAFADCDSLTSIDIPDGSDAIGCEAFAKCDKLSTVSISGDVKEVGPGAFNDCGSLSSVSFGASTSGSHVIDKFAFYNCKNLSSVDMSNANITSIDDAAFALSVTDVGNLVNFSFPDAIGTIADDNQKNDNAITSGIKHEGIGDFLFAGRSALSGTVTLPNNLGGKELPNTMFNACSNLGCVVFPESDYSTSFDPTIFYAVNNDKFYVRGPKADNLGKEASPRTSTWVSRYNYSKDDEGNEKGENVPYVYNDGTGDIYEVSDGNYILSIDNVGNLKSCLFAGSPQTIPELQIPAKVGNITVAAIDEGCFNNTDSPKCVLNYVKKFVIEDGSNISDIGNNAFYDAKNASGAATLEEIDLGNSIKSIGENAFKSCPELKTVTIGENINSIGNSAFEKCPKLIDVYFDNPGEYNIREGNCLKENNIGSNALTTGSPKLTVHGTIYPGYGPFDWSMNEKNFVDSNTGLRVCYNSPAPDNLTVILDNTNLLPTLVDYPHYEYLPESIREKVEKGETLETLDDQYAYNCTTEIRVPMGVKSIDVKRFINAKNGDPSDTGLYNGKSADAYLKDLKYYNQYKEDGLFNGYYGLNLENSDNTGYPTSASVEAYEYKTSESRAYEKDPRGNDRITAVYLEDVQYLPDKAFENCEKLNLVYLGNAMEDVGELPFYDCTNLGSASGGNGKYISEMGILYEVTSPDKMKIVECFASRGDINPTSVDIENDPNLANVYEILPHAFDNCDSLKFVDFEGADGISTIPEGCFANCDELKTVNLPTTVDSIEKKAFSNLGYDTEVVANNRQVFLSSGAFDKEGKGQPYFVTYKDAQSRKYASEQGANIDKTLDDYFTVKFYSYDGKILIGTDFVKKGKTAIPPDESDIPDRTAEGLVFDKWSIDLKNIQGDCFALAMYKPIGSVTPTPGVTPGVTPGITPGVTPGPQPVKPSPTPTKSATKYTLTVVYGSGSGQYPAGTKVIIEAIEAPAGKMFDKWVVTGASASVYSSTSKATTVTTAEGDSAVTATYKDITGNNSNSNNGSGSGSGSSGTYSRTGNGTSGTGNPGYNPGNSGTSVYITKPGISDRDKAYASVNGSTDSFVVKIAESADAANAAATALAGRYGDMTPIKYFAMDISLYDATGNNKITDTSNLAVNVTIPIPDALRQYGGNNKVGAVINGNQLEELPCKFVTVSGVPCVSFTATHFSPYMIYVDTNNLTAGTMDGSPKTGDPIHPKWFVVIALAATSLFLFLKKDKVVIPRAV